METQHEIARWCIAYRTHRKQNYVDKHVWEVMVFELIFTDVSDGSEGWSNWVRRNSGG
jgi:hypothetical protein